jgi:hypothetical protein
MRKEIVDALDACLDQLTKGSTTEECLARFPELRSELESLLGVSERLRDIPRHEPRAAAVRRALVAVGGAMRARGPERLQDESLFQKFVRRLRLPRPIPRLATACFVVTAVLWVATSASARSVPGDLLYPLKLATERVTFVLASGPDRKAELRLTFADRRLDELVGSVKQGSPLDPDLLNQLLLEAELALDEAGATSEDEYRLLLAKLEHFNGYKEDVLTQIRPTVTNGDARLLDEAISVCGQRARWIRGVWKQEDGTALERRWGPGCRCD